MKIQIIKKIASTLIIFSLIFNILQVQNVSAVWMPFYSESKYSWQWNIWAWDWSSKRFYWNVNNSRSTQWMKWNFNNEIWMKWRMFTKWVSPQIYMAGYDINWDTKEDVLWGYGWKLYLWDVASGVNIWETAVYNIQWLISIENILLDWTKSLIVRIWTWPFYVWIIDWRTWNLTWNSNKLDWPIKRYDAYEWAPTIRTADTDNNWINELYLKAHSWYFSSIKLFMSWSIAVWETLWDTSYWSYSRWWYQTVNFAMWTWSWWKNVVWTTEDLTYTFYSSDIPENQTEKYKMPLIWDINDWQHPRTNALIRFYDFNWDSIDEAYTWVPPYNSFDRRATLAVQKYNSLSWAYLTNWSYSLPETLSWVSMSTPIPLRNYTNVNDSYLITKTRDESDLWNTNTKRIWFNSSWLVNTNTWKILKNENFNHKIWFIYDWSQWDIWGLFNNWTKDYVVLRSWNTYKFYTFNWTWTFNTWSTLTLDWSYYNLTSWKDKNCNTNLAQNFCSIDTDWNWLREFVVTDNNYFKVYEISDAWVSLINSYWPYNTIPWRIQYGYTENMKDMYILTYDTTLNTINYYRTDSENWVFTFVKKTNDTFNSWWQPSQMLISKLWDYNKLMLSWDWNMYDAREANPTNIPIKLWAGYYHTMDVDWDWNNEILSWNAVHTWNWVWNTTLKYPSTWNTWRVWDFNKDWVLDSARAYCTTDPNDDNITPIMWKAVSWKDWTELAPAINRSNWKWYCSAWYSSLWQDINGDNTDDVIIWTSARNTQAWSLSWWTMTLIRQAPTTIASSNFNYLYDLDGDWVNDIMRWTFWVYAFKANPTFDTIISPKNWQFYTNYWESFMSFWKDSSNKWYIVSTWLDWWVDLMNSTWSILFHKYFVDWKSYNSMEEVIEKFWWTPVVNADVFLWDFIGDNTLQVFLAWWDWFVYILNLNWEIIKSYNVWSSIEYAIHWDTNWDWILDILVSAKDGYVYQFANSNLKSPSWVKDWPNYKYDIQTQTDNKLVTVNFAWVTQATWYFVQLYNKTEKSVVFDWQNIWNNVKGCIVSADYSWNIPSGCTKINKSFSLNGKSIYVWRVQSYNTNVTSDTVESNWFSVLNVKIKKQVKKSEDFAWDFIDAITVAPWTIVSYKITVTNDSLITLWWAWYMNYDILPPQETASCIWITDCRTKNIIVTDYMPTTFSYMSNTSIVNWDMKPDAYFVKDNTETSTILSTSPWSTLKWKLPTNITIAPWASLEIVFDAIAK